MKKIIAWILVIAALVFAVLGLNGCSQSERVNYNIRKDADNFKVRRRIVALNTRTNEALFEVEGYVSLSTDEDGDLNVTIQTGPGEYKLFYAHLSKDVTYTSIQLDSKRENSYAYTIQFFPPEEVIQNGIVDVRTTE